MPRNGSGTYSSPVSFADEASSPPIEIAKLDEVVADLGAEVSNSVALDGQSNPTADLKMNGFRHTNVGAATALTQYGRVTEIIDQDYTYYVDTGAADAYVITPSPAIAAYEEGQKFCFRAAHGNTTASTLNVNGLGAITIKTPDGAALTAGAIVTGGYYEVVYDENTSPDRWVLMSPTSVALTDFARLSQSNAFSQTVNDANLQSVINGSSGASARSQLNVSGDTATLFVEQTGSGWSGAVVTNGPSGTQSVVGSSGASPLVLAAAGVAALVVSTSQNFDFKGGTVTTNNASAAEVGKAGLPQTDKTNDYTGVLTDANNALHQTGASKTFTIPANGSVAYPIGTTLTFSTDNASGVSIAITSDTLRLAGTTTTGTRTLAQYGQATARKIAAAVWLISGAGLS